MAGVPNNFIGQSRAALDAGAPAAPWIPSELLFGANLVIVLAYLFVAGLVVFVVRKRPDLGNSQTLIAFAAFLMISGVGRPAALKACAAP